MPYFQCFFVDEDEAQYPFYPFSPLQMWEPCPVKSTESRKKWDEMGDTFSVELIIKH